MKQRISTEQLQELSEEQKERLREWWWPKWGDVFADGKGNKGLVTDTDVDITGTRGGIARQRYTILCLPLLSIGQCVELLEALGADQQTLSVKKKPYGIYSRASLMYWLPGADGDDPCRTKADDLIDALWEAVKQVL